MHAGVVPPNALGVVVLALPLTNAVGAVELPTALAVIGDRCLASAPRPSLVFLDPPATHMVRRGNDAGTYAFGAPGLNHEVANTGADSHQAVLVDA